LMLHSPAAYQLSLSVSVDPAWSLPVSFSLSRYSNPLNLHSFPTLRSSDLKKSGLIVNSNILSKVKKRSDIPKTPDTVVEMNYEPDRKSTRLNSSHVSSSYAVFCLKKKIKN